jgi:hypothetical protein
MARSPSKSVVVLKECIIVRLGLKVGSQVKRWDSPLVIETCELEYLSRLDTTSTSRLIGNELCCDGQQNFCRSGSDIFPTIHFNPGLESFA